MTNATQRMLKRLLYFILLVIAIVVVMLILSSRLTPSASHPADPGIHMV